MNTNSHLLSIALDDAKRNNTSYICQLSNDVQNMLRNKLISYYTRESAFLGINDVESLVDEIMCEKVCELSHMFNPSEV